MRIQVIAPCFYPSRESVPYFTKSAARHMVFTRLYGVGRPFTDWIQTHITEALKTLQNEEASHILFTDASDAIFIQGMKAITDRYLQLGSPRMLVSEESWGMNAGGWLGETETAVAILEHLATITDIPAAGNPQERWRHAIWIKTINVTFDSAHRIFYVGTPAKLPDTCIIHCAGGYTDPKVGKQAILEPIWRMLGYER